MMRQQMGVKGVMRRRGSRSRKRQAPARAGMQRVGMVGMTMTGGQAVLLAAAAAAGVTRGAKMLLVAVVPRTSQDRRSRMVLQTARAGVQQGAAAATGVLVLERSTWRDPLQGMSTMMHLTGKRHMTAAAAAAMATAATAAVAAAATVAATARKTRKMGMNARVNLGVKMTARDGPRTTKQMRSCSWG
jgi:hypothetical protein